MGLGELIVERDGAFSGCPRLRNDVGRRLHVIADRPKQCVRVGEPSVGKCVVGILVDGLFEKGDAGHQVARKPFVPVIPAAQIQLIRFGVRRKALRGRGRPPHPPVLPASFPTLHAQWLLQSRTTSAVGRV